MKAFRAALLDVLLALSLAACVAPFAYTHLLKQQDGVNVSLPWLFNPCVMLATGKGLASCDLAASHPDVDRFLRQEIRELSADVVNSKCVTVHVDPYAECHRYLAYAIAAMWRLFGISWDSLMIFEAAVYGLMAALLYGLFRLGANRLFSLACTVLFMASTHMMVALTCSIRDVCKVPFLFCSFLILGRLISRPLSRRGVFALAGALGLTVGVGLGFRQDLLVCLPAGVIAVVYASCRREGPRGKVIASALLIYIVSFAVPGGPILHTMRQMGGGTPHYLLQSMCTEFEQTMQVGPASYDLVYLPGDGFVHSVMSSYAQRAAARGEMDAELASRQLFNFSPEIMRVGWKVWGETAKTFPADIVTRCLASTRQLTTGAGIISSGMTVAEMPWGKKVPWIPQRVLDIFRKYGVLLAAITLIAICICDTKTAIATLLGLLFVGAYMSLGFQGRHIFHMGFFPLWIAAFLADKVLISVWRILKGLYRQGPAAFLRNAFPWCGNALESVARFSLVAIVVIVVPLGLLRMYQFSSVGRLLDGYKRAATTPVDVERVESGDWVFFRPKAKLPCEEQASGLPDYTVPSDYLALDVAPSQDTRFFWIRYDCQSLAYDLGSPSRIEPTGPDDAGVTRCFFPVYITAEPNAGQNNDVAAQHGLLSMARTRFGGVAMPKNCASAFRGLYRVTDPTTFRLTPGLCLPGDTASFRRFQTVIPGAWF